MHMGNMREMITEKICVWLSICVCVRDDEMQGEENIPAACGFLPSRVPEVPGRIRGSAAETIIK